MSDVFDGDLDLIQPELPQTVVAALEWPFFKNASYLFFSQLAALV